MNELVPWRSLGFVKLMCGVAGLNFEEAMGRVVEILNYGTVMPTIIENCGIFLTNHEIRHIYSMF